MGRFSDLEYQEKRFLDNLNSLPGKGKKFVIKAYKVAERYHRGQERDEGGPYIIHCLRVTNDLIEKLGMTEKEVLAAALLHDTIEDTKLALNQVEKIFGRKVARLVANLSREHKGDTEGNKYQRKLRKHKEIIRSDKDTRAIKTLDHLDNVRSWALIPKNHPSRDKFKRWFKEAKIMYIPLAETVDRKIVDEIMKALERAKKLNGKRIRLFKSN